MKKSLGRFAAALGLVLAGIVASPSGAFAAVLNYTLYINTGAVTVTGAGGATLTTWGYGSLAGVATFPAPQLDVTQGDTVNITVVNNHTLNHNFVIKGVVSDTTAIAPGGSRAYSFTASKLGTFIYYDTLNKNINREMGMYGALVVRPATPNVAWTGGPAYTMERVWVIGDMDKVRWNDVAGAGGTVNAAVYRPNYFLINGKGGFDAMADHGTMIMGGLGETAIVRIVNGGLFSHSLHFHGSHFEVIKVDGVQQTSPFRKLDVINLPPLGTAEVIFPLNKLGLYPVHVHTAQMETANGVYLNGGATMIDIQ